MFKNFLKKSDEEKNNKKQIEEIEAINFIEI